MADDEDEERYFAYYERLLAGEPDEQARDELLVNAQLVEDALVAAEKVKEEESAAAAVTDDLWRELLKFVPVPPLLVSASA
jgi:hypothetical protein